MTNEPRPYHHGSLRETLIEEGRRILLEEGPQAVTLRELARRAGVSHGAPQRHFQDRDALLDAIAAQGFEELADQLEGARAPGTPETRLQEYAKVHVGFAVANGPLMELMFSRPGGFDSVGTATARAAARFYRLSALVFGDEDVESRDPFPWVLAGTLEGIGALVTTGRLPVNRVDEITRSAVRMLLPALKERLKRARSAPYEPAGLTEPVTE